MKYSKKEKQAIDLCELMVKEEKAGYMPSVRTLADDIGMSKSWVHQMLTLPTIQKNKWAKKARMILDMNKERAKWLPKKVMTNQFTEGESNGIRNSSSNA